MNWIGQKSVTFVVSAITLFLAVRALAADIKKLRKSTTTPITLEVKDTATNLLGLPVAVAVDSTGNHLFVMTYRGWIYSLSPVTTTTITFGKVLASVKMTGADTSVTTNNGVDFEAVALAVDGTGGVYAARKNTKILHYNSSLNLVDETIVTDHLTALTNLPLVGLTVGGTGSNTVVYAAIGANNIVQMNSSLSSFKLLTIPGGNSVKAIKAVSNGDLYVATSDGSTCASGCEVLRFDSSITLPVPDRGFVTGVPLNIAASSTQVIVATSDGLHSISTAVNDTQQWSHTGLIGVDLDNSSNVVTSDSSNVYALDTTFSSQLSNSTVLPPKSIAIAAGTTYVFGGTWSRSEGDPHLLTIDGVRYDFQSAGEFVLLRHARDSKTNVSSANVGTPNSPYDASEIQVRQFPVATTVNTCVSLNSAIAAQIGNHRVTYEPNLSGQPDPSGLQLRIDGKLVTLDSSGIKFDDGGRVVPTSASGGIEIDFPNDDTMFVTPGWWPSQGKWYLNVNVVPQQRAGGLMGDVPEGSWLPALPDGTSMGPAPTSPHEHYVALYERFADAWRVTDKNSLFDYAPGTSTKTFTTQGWPPENGSCSLPGMVPVQGTTEEVARQVCKRVPGDQANCIFDVKVTGLTDIANTYVASRSVQPVPETTQPKPRCCINWKIVVLLVLLGLLGLLVLWMLLRRRHNK